MTAYATAAQRRGHAAPAARVGARAGGALAASLFTLGLGLVLLRARVVVHVLAAEERGRVTLPRWLAALELDNQPSSSPSESA